MGYADVGLRAFILVGDACGHHHGVVHKGVETKVLVWKPSKLSSAPLCNPVSSSVLLGRARPAYTKM